MVFTRLDGKLQVSTQKRRPKFGNEFLHRVSVAPEAMATELAVQSAFVSGPMRVFGGWSRIVAVCISKALERRHLDRICGDAVEGAIPAVLDGRPRARKNPSTDSMQAIVSLWVRLSRSRLPADLRSAQR